MSLQSRRKSVRKSSIRAFIKKLYLYSSVFCIWWNCWLIPIWS